MAKLTREQIREGLKQVPMDALLVGAMGAKDKALSPKDREFAWQLANGKSKAEAYRKSRGTNPKPQTASRRGQALAKIDAIQAQKDAFELAIEAERLRTPAALRALVISKLTEKALDPEVKDAQQIKALELLGKVTEVAAFGPDRREVINISASLDIKAQLIASISEAMKAGGEDPDTLDADTLLRELATIPAPTELENAPEPEPPTAHPPNHEQTRAIPLLSNPHIRSSDPNEPENPQAPASNGAQDDEKLVPDLSP